MTNFDKLNEMISIELEDNGYIININHEDSVLLTVGKEDNRLLEIKVPSSLQGKGIGSLLIEIAKDFGVTNLWAEPFGENGLDNEQLIAFYERHGFEVKIVGENSTVMRLGGK